VLRTYKLAEADKIVVCMTHDAGLVRGVARGARRLKSRFGASLELWTVCDLTYFEKKGANW
jgi:DNA repair protein RecO (recombination protein O)